jgi:hypothetical protein
MVDFVTHVKGIEYILSVSAIICFLAFWEFLKQKPFKTVTDVAKDDLEFIKGIGWKGVVKKIARIASFPFIGLFYILMLPIGFFVTLGIALVNLFVKYIMKDVTFEWNPVEAYFSGRKK